MTWQAVTTTPDQLGESPFWHPREQMLYWVDIAGKKIRRCNVVTGAVETWPMAAPHAQEPGCIAPAHTGGLVVGLRDGVYRAPQWGGALTCLHRFTHDNTITRANDGKCDVLGRFWVGTVDESKAHSAAELISLDCRPPGSITVVRHAGGALTGNGLAWSPDNQTVYWSDTPRHVIYAWDWDASTNVTSNQRVFQRFEPKPSGGQPGMPGYRGRPDGAAVDVLGNYWVAMYEGARLLQFAPTGELLADIATPMQCPTMPCFGGDDLRTLYLTSVSKERSAQELAAYPLSGCVISMRVDVPGLPANGFSD
ncbi:MAG: SMP-30/gluconolactonase/LRE family protein [Rhodoferax sp.]|nr:SMP-30/gluconolactonase/LRE family protein [Rhodoferax sp.]